MTTFQDLDPATGNLVAEIQSASPEQVTTAIATAREALTSWSGRPFSERRELLARAAGVVLERVDELAETITREMGKPLADARGEVKGWAGGVEATLAEVERALEPEVVRAGGCETQTLREPMGVVAAITPWNFPVGMPIELLIPALATGNTVVFKPSEHVPLAGEKLAAALNEVLPAGVLELVHGEGDVGAALVAGDVDLVGFVGSRDTGKAIMKSASGSLKRLVLELGGKDPLIVFGDADLDAAADCAVKHALRNTGQVCCSVERIFVEESVAAAFEERVVERAAKWTHGSGFADGVRMGPMVSEEQRSKVVAQVDDAVKGGARLVMGGKPADGPGYFYPATVLADVGLELSVSRQETFGPVVSLSTFGGDEDEAVRLANDTPYGLGANVFTGDLEKGQRVARRIRSGQVGVNRYLTGTPGAPWVGARESGFGFLGGVDGHRQFTIPKSISYPVE